MELIEKFIRGMRIARAIRGEDAKTCADRAGIAHAMWVRMEQKSQGYNPTLKTLTSIASALGTDIEGLIALPEKADKLIAPHNQSEEEK